MCTCARVIRCVYATGQEASLPQPASAPAVLASRSLEPAEDPVQTRLHRLLSPDFYGYQHAPWKIFLRKEVLEPGWGWMGAEGPEAGGRPGQGGAEPGSGSEQGWCRASGAAAGEGPPEGPHGNAAPTGVLPQGQLQPPCAAGPAVPPGEGLSSLNAPCTQQGRGCIA